MPSGQEEENRRLLRVRDAMDRDDRLPLDVPALAALAHSSEAHFSRRFKAVFGETPARYLHGRPAPPLDPRPVPAGSAQRAV